MTSPGDERTAWRPPRPDRLYPVLTVTLLGLLGWTALSIHEMSARLGVVDTRLIVLEEGREKLESDMAAGLAQAREERRAMEGRLNGRLDDIAGRLPPAR